MSIRYSNEPKWVAKGEWTSNTQYALESRARRVLRQYTAGVAMSFACLVALASLGYWLSH